jgi:hypothetical protein
LQPLVDRFERNMNSQKVFAVSTYKNQYEADRRTIRTRMPLSDAEQRFCRRSCRWRPWIAIANPDLNFSYANFLDESFSLRRLLLAGFELASTQPRRLLTCGIWTLLVLLHTG